jgi:hypothetical protein
VYNLEYPKLGNRESEVTQLDRDIAPLQSAGEKRLRSTLFVEHDNMWPFNLRIDTQDEQEEIELSVSTRTAGVPKVANRLDFGARSENVNVALLNHLIHDIDLMPGPTARLGIRSEQTPSNAGILKSSFRSLIRPLCPLSERPAIIILDKILTIRINIISRH